MAKYYCGLCETSHHEHVEGASCPECGRKYCLDSLKQSFQAGVNQCPYCDTPFEWFPEIPVPFKRILRGEVATETPTITLPTPTSSSKVTSTTYESAPSVETETISTFGPNSDQPSYRRSERRMMGMGMRGPSFFMKNPMYIIMAIFAILMMIFMIFFVFGFRFPMMGP
jgi:hypothetical protein